MSSVVVRFKRLRELHGKIVQTIQNHLEDNLSILSETTPTHDDDSCGDVDLDQAVDYLSRVCSKRPRTENFKHYPAWLCLYQPEFANTALTKDLIHLVLGYLFFLDEKWSVSFESRIYPQLWKLQFECSSDQTRIARCGTVEPYDKSEFGLLETDPDNLAALQTSNGMMALVVRPLITGDWPLSTFGNSDELNIVLCLGEMSIACCGTKLSDRPSVYSIDLYDYGSESGQKFLATTPKGYGCGQLQFVNKQLDRIIFYLNTTNLPLHPST